MDMKTEPSVIVATITGFVTALIALLVAFGLDLTSEQQNAILGIVAVIAPVIAGIIIRGKVFSPATVDELTTTAYDPMDASTWPRTAYKRPDSGTV